MHEDVSVFLHVWFLNTISHRAPKLIHYPLLLVSHSDVVAVAFSVSLVHRADRCG